MHTVARATYDELCGVVSELEAFWGTERDMGFLHQTLYFHEFGDTALVAREDDGTVDGYLLGFLGPASIGYIHAVAVRDGRRGAGLASRLYEQFEQLVRLRGAVALKAITDPSNERSIAYHQALGFSTREVADYTLTGGPRVVFYKQLPSG
jgi:ribosomal protein S18 acetylase RimI-like enzyme